MTKMNSKSGDVMQVTIQDEELNRVLSKMSSKVKDLRPVMRDIANLLLESIQKNFKAEGRPVKWKPLAPSTIANKVKRKGTWKPILVDTGLLRKSNNTDYGKNYAKVVNPIKYGIYHQMGTKKMPARPFMVLQEKDKANIIDLMRRYIENVR